MVLLPLMVTLSACGPDQEQVRICRSLIPALHTEQADFLPATATDDSPGLRQPYRVNGVDHWIECQFAGRNLAEARRTLVAVATDRTGPLSDVNLHLLRRWAGLPQPFLANNTPAAAAPPVPIQRSALFILQQLINAVTVACVYGLLAVGHSMVFAVIGQINLALGELTMVAAMITAMAAWLLASPSVGPAVGAMPWLVLPPLLLLVISFTGVYGWAMDRMVFRPLRGVRGHTPLIAAVGLAIAAQEGVRLLQGARDWWPRPPLDGRHDLISGAGFTVTILTAQIAIIAGTVLSLAGLALFLKRSRHGLAYRACVDDLWAARLVGVDSDRVIATCFVIAAAFAALAGFTIALNYGGVNFLTGYLVGFKALAAAVVGGIGSIPGAILGALLLAATETLWSAWFSIAHKDVVAFALLTLCLILRPQGLMGRAAGRGD